MLFRAERLIWPWPGEYKHIAQRALAVAFPRLYPPGLIPIPYLFNGEKGKDLGIGDELDTAEIHG